MRSIAFLAAGIFVSWLLVRDVRNRRGISPAIWLPLFWVVIVGTRPVSSWFQSGNVAGAGAYDEGNPFERNTYLFLLGLGLIVLRRRGLALQELWAENKWLFLFFFYWLLSVLWAEMPFVAFKRWIKDTGNVLMVLVILTERDPVETLKAVFVRAAILLSSLSILFIRYFPEYGRSYDPAGFVMFTGVATHKNTLGVLAMMCSLFLFWEVLSRRDAAKAWRFPGWPVAFLLLGMNLWLVAKANSATSLSCTVIGVAILLGLRRPAIQTRLPRLEIYMVAIAGLYWLLDSMFGLYRIIIVDILGRDLTLTSRTDVWPILLSEADNPLIGSGFMGFWTGERFKYLFEKYAILQAHNGYLELYLNGGLVAIFLFAMLAFTCFRNIKLELMRGDRFAPMKFVLLIIGLVHNVSEASISKGGLMWFALLLALTRYRGGAESTVEVGQWEPSENETAHRQMQVCQAENGEREADFVPNGLWKPAK